MGFNDIKTIEFDFGYIEIDPKDLNNAVTIQRRGFLKTFSSVVENPVVEHEKFALRWLQAKLKYELQEVEEKLNALN